MKSLATFLVVCTLSSLYSRAIHPHSDVLAFIDAWNTSGLSMISIFLLTCLFKAVGMLLSPVTRWVEDKLP